MRKLLLLIVLLAVAWIPVRGDVVAQDVESDAPYLYYYSDLLNAFVIERADGSDSRVFGAGLMPEETVHVDGPGWSPSGEWFAWTAARYSPAGYYGGLTAFRPFALNVDGQQRVTVLDDMYDAKLAWSSDGDWLLAAGALGDYDSLTTRPDVAVRLVDPATDQIVAESIIQTDEGYYYYSLVPDVVWTADNQYAIAYYQGDPYRPSHVFILDHQGNATHRQFDDNIVTQFLRIGLLAYPSPDEDALLLEDIATSQIQRLPETLLHISNVAWNQQGTWAGVLTVDCTACVTYWQPCEFSSWLLDAETMTFWPLDEFLSDRLDLARWHWRDFWSPDGNRALYQRSSTGAILHLNIQSPDMPEVMPVPDDVSWVWDSGIRVTFHYAQPDNLNTFIVADFSKASMFTQTTDDEQYLYSDGVRLSPDATHGAYIDGRTLLYDFVAQTRHELRPDGRSWQSNSGGQVRWHPDGQWFFTGENSSVAGGGGGPLWSGVVNVSGDINRDLALCGGLETTCIDWLPPQVNTNALPPGHPTPAIPEPERILHGTNWVGALNWSPDGRRLFFGGGWYYDDLDSWLWDVSNEEIIATYDLGIGVGIWNETVFWELDETMGYVPHVESSDSNVLWPAFSPDGRYYVEFDYSQTAVFLTKRDVLVHVIEPSWGMFHAISFTSDSRWLAAGGQYNRVQIIDTTTWQTERTLNTNSLTLAFSPDGQWLAVGSSWDIQLWDVETLVGDTP